MKNNREAAFWLLLAIVLFLPACAVRPAVTAPAPVRASSLTPAAATRPARAVTPTKTVLPTRALPAASAPPVPPEPVNDPSPNTAPTAGPLSARGPWLVVSKDEIMDQASSGYVVMNADGTNPQPVALPAPPKNRVWRFLAEPRGPFLAFRTMPLEGSPKDIQADGIDDHVWIIQLPDNRVVRKLPLLSDAAWDAIDEARKNDPDAFDDGFTLPTQLGLVVNPDSFQWSPHGRYLTYSAALDGSGTDLYMYDTEKDVTRRLTQGRTGAQIWFWSPDGSTLFYRNGAITTLAYALPDLAQIDGVYSLSLFTGEQKLYAPASEIWEQVINLTDEDFLVMDYGFETIPWNLRLVNYRTGSIRTLVPGSFSSAAADEAGQTILLLFDPSSPFAGQIKEKAPGIYRLNFAAGKLDFVREGGFSVHSVPGTSLFHTQQKTGDGTLETILFNASGQEVLRLPDAAWLSSSPDGQWIFARSGDTWKLYSIQGEAKTDQARGEVYWLKDSSGFYAASCCDHTVRFYAVDNNWQPVIIYNEDFASLYLVPSEEP